jgi:hypothetical protein
VEQRSFLNDVSAAPGVRPRQITRIQPTEGILELVRAGVGVAPWPAEYSPAWTMGR